MSEEQYWDRDCTLVRYYREADKLRNDRIDYQAWLNGLYVYEALARISPILHDFAKKGTKAQPYVKLPHSLEKREELQDKPVEVEKNLGKTYMEMFMLRHNKRFEKKERAS